MTQVAILSGIYTDANSDFKTSYPRNLVPVALKQGISEGYLRPGDGLIQEGSGPGVSRGSINWNGQCYRVMGTKLILVDALGGNTVLGDVGDGGWAKMDYSFDRLAIASGARFYYYKDGVLTQVTDPDLGPVYDFMWIDGYFMTTDKKNLVVPNLDDPTSVDPLKYGSSEEDPDDIECLLKLRGEAYALNRYTIEVFNNVGGDHFPFQRVNGAVIQRGAMGARCGVVFMEMIAFLGSGRNESPGVYVANNGTSQSISTRAIEQTLKGYSESTLSNALLEVRVTDNQQLLYVRLPDQTLVYNGIASSMLNQPIWFSLDSGLATPLAYRAANFVWCYDKWLCADPTSTTYGHLTLESSSHYDQVVGWEFKTGIIYNESNGAQFNELELVCLPGRVELGIDPTIWTSYSVDGITWSQERPRRAGMIGNRLRRLTWFGQGLMRNWRIQKFRGNSDAHLSIARLEIDVEALSA